MFLKRSDILTKSDRTYEIVEVPEWNGEVRIRSLTARERDKLEISMIDDPTTSKKKQRDFKMKLDNMRAKFIALIVCDEEGRLLFEEEDIEVLGEKNAAAISRIYDAGQKLNGMSAEDLEAKKEKLEADPILDSPID